MDFQNSVGFGEWVLSCHSEKLVRHFDPFIPITVYSYSLKPKIDVDLDDKQLALSENI